MSGSAYLYSAPNGVAGDLTRTDESNVEPAMLVAVSGVYAQAFGIPVKYVTGGIQQFNGGAEVAGDFAGVLVREAPEISGSQTAQGLGGGVPYSSQVQGLCVRGYVSVLCAAGTPVRGGAVYVQIIANGGVAVGSFRASADGSNTILLSATQAEWATDGVDSNLNAELRIAR